MCCYVTVKTPVTGSGKGASGWFSLSHASVYFDHPYHAPLEHTLNIDFIDASAGPGAHVAVELSADSARRLVESIQSALAAGERSFQRDTVTSAGKLALGQSRLARDADQVEGNLAV
jgi:hypothetical protein